MKREIWLKTNRRIYLLFALPLASTAIGSALVCLIATSRFWQSIGGSVLAAALAGLFFICFRAWQPRLAYADGQLFVFLRVFRPIRIPIHVVECFFLGQGASLLPHSLEGKHGEGAETATVVIRLAEAAHEWSQGEVLPSLGQWCEGYITIRGTWCEPLSGGLVAELNGRLVAAHRAQKQLAGEAVQV